MRILQLDERTRQIKVVPESLDDLWHLSKIIEPSDELTGATDRAIKPKSEGQKPMRVKLHVTLQVEKLEFHRSTGQLRANGIILRGTPEEFIEEKAHQALEIHLGEKTEIQKHAWKEYQITRLKKARDATGKNALVLVCLDDDSATFAVLKEFEIEPRGIVASQKTGKREDEDPKTEEKYFQSIEAKLLEMKTERAVLAGPGFSPEKLQKFAAARGWSKKFHFVFEKTNDAGLNGVYELVKGNALSKIAADLQVVSETQRIEKALAELGKNSGKIAYGLDAIQKALDLGAVDELLIGERMLAEKPEDAETLTSACEKMKGKVHVIGMDSPAGKQLEGLGGALAMLRYPLN